jgi:hypothetical protein
MESKLGTTVLRLVGSYRNFRLFVETRLRMRQKEVEKGRFPPKENLY